MNAGVQVLITTHSNDFTGQINNLISMSNVSEETWKSLGLEPEECLQPDQVSAYGFRIDQDKGGAVTYPLPVGSDVGIEDEEFLPVIELLYDQAIKMQRMPPFMTLASMTAGIRESHKDCCIDHSINHYEEKGCRLDIRDIQRSSLTALNGSRIISRDIPGKGGSAIESSSDSRWTGILSAPLN